MIKRNEDHSVYFYDYADARRQSDKKKRKGRKTRAFHLYVRPQSNEKDRSRMKLRLEYHRTISREIRP